MITDKASSAFSRELEAQIKGHACYCGAELNTPWGGTYGINEYIVRCSNGHINPELKKVKSDWQLWKEGILIDPYRDMVEARKRGKEKETWRHRRR